MQAQGWNSGFVLRGIQALAEQDGQDASGFQVADVLGWLRNETYPVSALAWLCRLFCCHQSQLGWPAIGNDPPIDYTRPPTANGRDATGVIQQILSPASITAISECERNEDLPYRILEAWKSRKSAHREKPVLVIVGGFPGSGKTEFSRFLSAITGWTIIDKDIATRPLTDTLLQALGSEAGDRHSKIYSERVRPLEYLCLQGLVFDNLSCGISTIATAPFLLEITDEAWLKRLANRCAAKGVDTAMVWMECDIDTMHERLQTRGAARDRWKLSSWEDYLASIDLALRPRCDHYVVDNRLNATISLAEQAQALANRIGV